MQIICHLHTLYISKRPWNYLTNFWKLILSHSYFSHASGLCGNLGESLICLEGSPGVFSSNLLLKAELLLTLGDGNVALVSCGGWRFEWLSEQPVTGLHCCKKFFSSCPCRMSQARNCECYSFLHHFIPKWVSHCRFSKPPSNSHWQLLAFS